MLSEPRTIFFQTRLDWPEVPDFRVTRDLVRRLYNKLHESDFETFRYDNINLGSVHCDLSTHIERSESICRFGDDWMIFIERHPNFTVDGFLEKIRGVLRALHAISEDADGVRFPPFITQRTRVQALSQPQILDDSLNLLAGRVANAMESIDPFGRPPAFFGVRFRFPPCTIEHAAGAEVSHDDFATVRFETYSEDPQQVWMECDSFSLFSGELPAVDDSEKIEQQVRSAYRFLTENCKQFLDQFDVSDDEQHE